MPFAKELTELVLQGGVVAVLCAAVVFLVWLWRQERAERKALQDVIAGMMESNIRALVKTERSANALRDALAEATEKWRSQDDCDPPAKKRQP